MSWNVIPLIFCLVTKAVCEPIKLTLNLVSWHTHVVFPLGYSLISTNAVSSSLKMQLFLRAQNIHTLEVTGQETVKDIKVRIHQFTCSANLPSHSVLEAFSNQSWCFRLMSRLWKVCWWRSRCCCWLALPWRMTSPWLPVESLSSVLDRKSVV